MRFCQSISVRCDDPDALVAHLVEWDEMQATSELMGYIGTRLLGDRDDPGHYLIVADFAEVDGDLPPAEEAERNNHREATQRWAEKLRSLLNSEPGWSHFDELYRTGLTGNLRTG